MTAFYNEIDPKAAAWLRELISRGLIAPGVVDERDIRDIRPADLHGFAQCHFFAGIGVWSYALRRAGWPDERPVWTGSCPCQPFSAAGKGAGFDDERHLWPSFFWLIGECRPAIVFGEQVASKDAEPWIDLVQDDLEAVGYAVGAVPFPSAGVGAPHIRDRLYWVADAGGSRLAEQRGRWIESAGLAADSPAHVLADACGTRLSLGSIDAGGQGTVRIEGATPAEGQLSCGLADASEPRRGARGRPADASDGRDAPRVEPRRLRNDGEPGPTNGLWRDADWLLCRDGKWRPVEPGTFPLAHGAPARVGRLRGCGNAINAEAARVFVEAYLG